MKIAPDLKPNFTREYEIVNEMVNLPRRKIPIYATPQELEELDHSGFLVRNRLFKGEQLEALRMAVEELEEQEKS